MTLTSSVGCGKLIIYFACFWLTALAGVATRYNAVQSPNKEYPLYTVPVVL